MDDKVKQIADEEQKRAPFGFGAVIRGIGELRGPFTRPVEHATPADPALSAETLNAEGLKRLAATASPDVEILRSGLRSRKLAERLDAAMWVARFDDKPGFEFLRPLRTRAAGIVADAMSFRTEPVLSTAAAHEIDTELLQLLYERSGTGFLTAVEQVERKARHWVN
jgi:hypothetical protein